MIRNVNAAASSLTNEEGCDRTTGTLADLLCADRTDSIVLERDWVRLIGAVGRGDQRALRLLYERTQRVVFTLIMRIVDERECAEELTLELFHDVWRGSAPFDAAGGTVVAWILSQARCRAIERVRFNHRTPRTTALAREPGSTTRVSEADDVLDQGQARRLRNALASLTETERLAIEDAYCSQLSYVEVAQRLRGPLETVQMRIRSGLEKLSLALTGGAEIAVGTQRP